MREFAQVRQNECGRRQAQGRREQILPQPDVGKQTESVADHVHGQDEADENDAPEEVLRDEAPQVANALH